MVKGTKLYSTLYCKCPRCQEGNLFIHKNPYDLRYTGKMPERCHRCGLKFTPEPGYYFGAAYVAYALSVALAVIIFLSLFPFWGWSHVNFYIIIIASTLVVISPLMLRLSRSAWISFFYKYDENAVKNYEEKRDLKAS